MLYPALLELVASLTAQVTLVIGIAALATRRQKDQINSDRLWVGIHYCILLLSAAALLLPHFRPATMGDIGLSERMLSALDYYQLIGKLFCSLWLCGVAVVMVAVVGGVWRATSLLKQASRNDELTQLANQLDLATKMRKHPPEVRVSPVSISPICWQFHHPIIIVPDLLLEIPQSEQVAILKHELAHLTLRHPLHLFLQRIVEAVYWYHPLVWWASRRAAAAREIRCDWLAVRNRQEVADYLRSLLRMIEAQVSPPVPLPAGLGFVGNQSLLYQRTLALTQHSDNSSSPCNRGLGGAIILAIIVGILVWLPVNPLASRRSLWSPWPRWSAHVLDTSGIAVRDYEVDGHRLQPHDRQCR